MNTEEAVYTIAHDEGIDLSRFLTREQVERTRALVAQLGRPQPAAAKTPARRDRRAPKPAVVTIRAPAVTSLPGMTAPHAAEAKAMAEKVYPMLYVFENSARDVISRVLKDAVGDDWFEKVVSKPLQQKVADRKASEDKEPWHGKRGAHPINYLDLPDLAKIVKSGKAWPHFKALDLFPRESWFEELVADMNVSRRVIAHMNPLKADDIRHIEATFRKWARQIEARKDRLP